MSGIVSVVNCMKQE